MNERKLYIMKHSSHNNNNLLFTGKCVVFVDAANLANSAKKFGKTVDYKRFAQYFHSCNQATSLRYYGPTFHAKKQQGFFGMLDKIGFTIITKPIKVIRDQKSHHDIHKANFYVELAVDAVILLKYFDVFILFSGDSDFVYLCQYLKRHKKTIVIFSTRYRIAKELIDVADQFIDIKEYAEEFLRIYSF